MEYVHKYLKDKIFVGLVEDNVDPRRLGRVKVRVQSLYDDLTVDQLPWSNPFFTSGSGKKFDIPAVGKIVTVIFVNDILYDPYYINSDHFNINLQEKLQTYSDDEYKNFVALLFDHKTQIYSDDTNLTIDYKLNKMTIDNESINHELKDNNQKLNLGDSAADQQSMLGNHWIEWFSEFVEALLKPTSLVGNLGVPIVKPEIDTLLTKYNTIKETFLSRNVYVVDNNEVNKLKRTPNSKPIEHDSIKFNEDILEYSDELKTKIADNFKQNLEDIKSTIPTDIVNIEEDLSPAIDADGSGSFVVDKTDDSQTQLSGIKVLFSGDTIADNEQVVTPSMIVDDNGNKKYIDETEKEKIKTEEGISYGIPADIDYSPDDILTSGNPDLNQNTFGSMYDNFKEEEEFNYKAATDEEFKAYLEQNKQKDSIGNIYVVAPFTTSVSSQENFKPLGYDIGYTPGYILPIGGVNENILMNSPYGPRYLNVRTFHPGLDFKYGANTPIVAINDGIVYKINENIYDMGGRYLKIKHSDGLISGYLHLNKINVKVGQPVKKGDVIAYSGNSGGVTGNKTYGYHLHFQIEKYIDGKICKINPSNVTYSDTTFKYVAGRELGALKNNKIYTGLEIYNNWPAGQYVYTTPGKFSQDVRNGLALPS